MKILFPTDGSTISLAALRGLDEVVQWFSDEPQIVLMTVHAVLPYSRAVAWAGVKAVQEYYEEENESALEEARKTLERAGRTFTVAKRVGDPAEEIVRFAHEERCDLVAMSTQGRSALTNLLMGSVATKVLAGSGVPVLLLKKSVRAETHIPPTYRYPPSTSRWT